jgi:hypothetical protein
VARFLRLPPPEELPEEDPLAGVANLFDVSVVFIVGLMITLFSIYRMGDLVDAQSEVTVVKTNAQGEREIIMKKGTEIKAYKVTDKAMSGNGERLGVAYRLSNGQIIYVPEGASGTPDGGAASGAGANGAGANGAAAGGGAASGVTTNGAAAGGGAASGATEGRSEGRDAPR